jgi:hypothetical protein
MFKGLPHRRAFWVAIGAAIASIVMQLTGINLRPFVEPAADVVVTVVEVSGGAKHIEDAVLLSADVTDTGE